MLLLELLSRLQNFNTMNTPILKSLHWLKVFEWIEYKIISLTKLSILLSLRICMTSYLFSLLTVTTHALHLMSLIKPSSSLKVTHRSFRHASPHLWNQLPTSLRIPHPTYSSPSQRPSFEHASLTCYTLLSPSITFSLLHSQLKTYLFRKSYPPP